MKPRWIKTSLLFAYLIIGGCVPTPAGGSSCESTDDCPEGQKCLTEFKGGYCGEKGCDDDSDCPDDTICVVHDGDTFCFLTCTDKPECNTHRGADEESNCSANVERIEGGDEKACVPPSGD